MENDLAELMKSGRSSLAAIAGNTGPTPMLGMAKPKKRSVLIPAFTITLVIGAVGAAGFFLVRTLLKSSPGGAGAGSPIIIRVPPPPPYFATETSRTISVKKQDRAGFLRLMADTWREKEREGTVKRIVIKVQDGPNERFATLTDFFELWRVPLPQRIAEIAEYDLMAFMYAGQTGNRLGFAVRTRDPERTFADMLRWEPALLTDAAQFFFDEKPDTVVAAFEDRTWRNIDWRYLKLSQEKDLGIGYVIFPVQNVLVFTTAKDGAETVINRLFDAR